MQMKTQKKWIFALCAVCLLALAAMYIYWLFNDAAQSIASLLLSALLLILFAYLCVYAARAFIESLSGEKELELSRALGKRSLKNRHPIMRLFFALLFFRLALFILAYMLYLFEHGYEGALMDTLSLWNKGDAPHYLGIAQNWYTIEGDARFHIVFFPFYPLLVRLFDAFVQNVFVSGLFLSVLFTAFSGVLLYELALLDLDQAAAKRAIKFQMLLPAAFLFNAPMSDSLFLLLSIACVLLARKKRYVLACAVGALAAFTRVLGILLLVPVAVELLGDAFALYKQKSRVWMFLIPRAVSLLLIPMGFLAYLIVNHDITGSAFTFLIYEREHWSQGMGFFFHTAAYQTEYFLRNVFQDAPVAFGLWLPNLIALFFAPLIMLLAAAKDPANVLQEEAKEDALRQDSEGARPLMRASSRQPYALRASYLAYFLAYYFISMGATWLLSAPRYLTACFPLSIALSRLCRKRAAILFAYALLAALQLLYMLAYVKGWPVY